MRLSLVGWALVLVRVLTDAGPDRDASWPARRLWAPSPALFHYLDVDAAGVFTPALDRDAVRF